jgi:hypothetical protein
MLKPANLFRMLTEFIFILLGGFLVWLGLNNRLLDPPDFHPQRPAWLGVGAALVYWGARAWVKTSRSARTSERAISRVGGASLALVGLMMFALVALQFRWAGVVLAIAGAVLAIRGFLGAVLCLRTN